MLRFGRRDTTDCDFAFCIDDKWVVLIQVCSNYFNVANIRLISNIFRIIVVLFLEAARNVPRKRRT